MPAPLDGYNYTLDKNNEVIPVTKEREYWSIRDDPERRRVGDTKKDGYRISTMFVCFDFNVGEGDPLVFETKIFPEGSYDEKYLRRYHTWAEAEQGHEETVGGLEECLHVTARAIHEADEEETYERTDRGI